MASLFAGYEVDEELRPVARLLDYDFDQRLASMVALEAHIPEDAYSARTLQTERIGNAIVIGEQGLMLTIGYLVTEAEEVIVTTNAGARIEAHVLGIDQATGFGLLHALGPLGLPAMPIGDSRKVRTDAPVISVGAGGRSHALSGRILAREAFAGYWEYYLEAALFVEPAHPHWNGAALIGPSGDLIGVGSLKMEQMAQGEEVSPLNMFVPAELLPPILDDLSHGRPARPPRPWLGVISQEISSHVVVADVSEGGPASRAELRRGDVIHRIAGHRVATLADFYKRLWALGPPGAVAELTIQREHDVFDVAIRTADRQAMQKKRRLN
ncbi:MAG TPA: S1C family serine protease [Caulobacteraceae bacterium]|nr:S1C family serine protease [Caulobacteraceae bacterium]